MRTKTIPLYDEENISRREKRENRFFDRALSNIPRSAVIICANGVFGRGERSVSYTYRHCGQTFTTTLKTENGGTRA